MTLGLLGLVAANAASLLGAHEVLRGVRTGTPSIDAVLFGLLRLLLVSLAVAAAGALGMLTPLGLGLAGLFALGLLVASGAHRRLPRWRRPDWNPWLVAAAGVVLLRLLVQVWVFAPYSGDALAYHLPKIAEWVRAGGFTREMGLDPRVTLPSGFELVETWWVVFLHHDVLIEVAGVEFLLLGCASVYALARSLEGTPGVALGAAIVFGMTPGLHLQATSELNDGPPAALVLATAALLLARAHPALVLGAAGLGVGIKPTYGYALPGLAVLAWAFRAGPRLPVVRGAAAWGVAAAALGLGSIWYLRNLVWFGNPIYPLGTPLVGRLQQVGPRWESVRDNLTALVNLRIYDRVAAPGALHWGNANWGAAPFAVGAPAVIWLLRESPAMRRLALAFGLSLVSVMALVTFDLHNSRFLLFFPALPALALARVAAGHRLIAAVAVAAVGLEFMSTCLPSELSPARLREMVGQRWAERSARPAGPAAGRGEPLGCYGEDWPYPYWLYDPDFSRRVVYLRERSLGALLDRLRREQVRRFYVSHRARSDDAALWAEGVRAGRWDPFQDGLGTGYRLAGPGP